MLKNKLLLLVLFSFGTLASAASIEGKWRTIDDKTHQAKSIVEIYRVGSTYSGRVVKLLPAATAKLCYKCTGAAKNRPVEGMTILTGLKKTGPNLYDGGKLLDPESGNTYSGSAQVLNDGKSLSLRGYIGFKLFGRSQVWQRVQ
ncbi:MAG: DUF2147 domain-containing protein [Neisseriaceae bacterium]